VTSTLRSSSAQELCGCSHSRQSNVQKPNSRPVACVELADSYSQFAALVTREAGICAFLDLLKPLQQRLAYSICFKLHVHKTVGSSSSLKLQQFSSTECHPVANRLGKSPL